jgi:hypothetical protein
MSTPELAVAPAPAKPRTSITSLTHGTRERANTDTTATGQTVIQRTSVTNRNDAVRAGGIKVGAVCNSGKAV